MTRIVSIELDGAAAARAALEETILAGGVAVFPADGLYGLACDPLREEAIRRIHEIKGRDDGKPSAVMYFSPLMLRELVAGLGPRVRAAVAALLPGPVTLVVPNPEHRYPLACRADRERLGIRLIEGPLAGANVAVFQTSANANGEQPPAAFTEIPPDLIAEVDLAIDGGNLTGHPSTVIDLTTYEETGTWKILRKGALSASQAARHLDPVPPPN